jgi:hypothetical protein
MLDLLKQFVLNVEMLMGQKLPTTIGRSIKNQIANRYRKSPFQMEYSITILQRPILLSTSSQRSSITQSQACVQSQHALLLRVIVVLP